MLKIAGLMLLVFLGISIIVFGGYDDSPGAQDMGLIVAMLGVWKLYKEMRVGK